MDLEQPIDCQTTDHELVGTVLADEFEILAFLGAGGMSSVYKARHRSMDRIVAVKILHEHLLGDARKLERFRTEAKTTSALHHPNIVDVYSFVEGSGKPFLVMDYIDGESLQQRLKASGKLDAASVVHIFRQACAALAQAHALGIIHRDVKPSNIMLCKDKHADTVKLLDFGIAKLLPRFQPEAQSLTQTDALLGSPLYMSPEQCSNHAVDERSDIYSLGCVMYETLTGRPAVQGESPLAIMYGHLHEMPPAIDASSVPTNLQSVVFKALQKEPEKRYQTMSELEADLKSIDADSKHSLPSVATAQHNRRKVSPMVLIAIAALPMVAMGLFIVSHNDQFAEPALEVQLYANSLMKGSTAERIKLLLEKAKSRADAEDFAIALKSFDEAIALSESAQLFEQTAVAKSRRAVLAYKTTSTNQPTALNKARNEYDLAMDIYLNLARAALDGNRYADMERLLKELERLDEARPMKNIAYIHRSKVEIIRAKMATRQGKLDVAEQWARKAVDYCQAKEPDSLHHADAMIRLAGILLQEKKNQEGHHLLDRANIILASLTPPQLRMPGAKTNPAIKPYLEKYPAFKQEMHNLGSVILDASTDLLALGRNDEALKLTKQAKTILTAGPSPSLHLATASSVLAVQYASRHELGKAVNEYRQAIAICDETGTPLAQTLKLQIKYGLANVLKQNNKREEARQHLDEIIHAREIDIANHNNETAAAEAILACYLEKAASYTDPLSSEREECFQQMTNLYREGAPLSQLQAAMLAQAHFYLADIKSTKAKTYSVAESDLLKSEQFWAKAAGPNPASAATYDHLSRLEKARGNLNKAREYLHKALDIYKATVGPNDPSYKASKAALANLQSN